ncbi:MAG: DUF2088 domain-containing protein [Bryobacteraceae bacterium]|nr:DUF2088 domain-containing protein [Bryobacteraceae bacterium]
MLTSVERVRQVRARPFEFPAPAPNCVGRLADVSPEGCVVTLDERSAPRLLWYGEDLLDVKLPAGTRIVYPKPTIPGVPNRKAGLRHALENPEEMEPLEALLRPGMKVTICIDDISLPLPKFRRPDARQEMLEIVLEMLAAHGVDDFHIVIVTTYHRRMEPFEILWQVGQRIFDAYYPGQLYNMDADGPGQMVELGRTELDEPVRVFRRIAEADLVIYLNVNLVPMDGGAKSLGVGAADFAGLASNHNPATIIACDSYFDHTQSPLTASADRINDVIDRHLKVFHVETVINNQMFDPTMEFFVKNEDRWNALDKASFKAAQYALRKVPRNLKREILFKIPSAYKTIAIHAGECHAVHEKTVRYCYAQYCVPVEGQSDVMVAGVPFIMPYNVNSILNPILVHCLVLGYVFNMYRNMPLVKKNGVLIMTHPLYAEFDPRHHPSYIELFHRILPETRDPFEIQRKYEEEFVHDPDYLRIFRTGYGYHGVHALFMWYWGQNGRHHVGKVIVVGAEDPRAARTMGWETAATMEEALDMAKSHVGRTPSVAHLKLPPINMADMLGRPESVGNG